MNGRTRVDTVISGQHHHRRRLSLSAQAQNRHKDLSSSRFLPRFSGFLRSSRMETEHALRPSAEASEAVLRPALLGFPDVFRMPRRRRDLIRATPPSPPACVSPLSDFPSCAAAAAAWPAFPLRPPAPARSVCAAGRACFSRARAHPLSALPSVSRSPRPRPPPVRP